MTAGGGATVLKLGVYWQIDTGVTVTTPPSDAEKLFANNLEFTK